jgi:cation:H+ antiporter
MILENILIFTIAVVVLIISGSLVVKTLSKIAAFLHVSEYVIGFIILAFATSLPELFVGITSALEKNTALVLGTIIGANIANLTYIIGIPILLAKGMKIHSPKTMKDSLYMVVFAALPLALMLIGNQLSRVDGIILLAAFSIYAYKLIKERKEFRKELKDHIGRWEIILAVVMFIFAFAFLYLSADMVVEYAGLLALNFAVPPILIGLFLVAVGTSLPELVSGLTAALKGSSELAIGNIIGSVIANSTLILGITAIIFPITSDFLLFITSGVYMLIVTFVFATFARSGTKLEWEEGISLLLLYAFFIIMELFVKGYI